VPRRARINLIDDGVLSTVLFCGSVNKLRKDGLPDNDQRSGSKYRATQIVQILLPNSDRSSSSRVSRFVGAQQHDIGNRRRWQKQSLVWAKQNSDSRAGKSVRIVATRTKGTGR
jgi:hypothetical protein